jgi:hypothetical protein
MADNKPNPDDAAGGAEGGMAGGSAGGPQGNSLKDLSDEAVRELDNEEEPHAGRGDYG